MSCVKYNDKDIKYKYVFALQIIFVPLHTLLGENYV